MVFHLVLVMAGGALGAGLRHLTNIGAARLLGVNFPWGTLAVNVIGGFIMGVFIEMLARRWGGSLEWRLFVATGVLGGYTTFSAFSLDVAVLYERGELAYPVIYVAGSLILSIGGLFLGLWLARSIA